MVRVELVTNKGDSDCDKNHFLDSKFLQRRREEILVKMKKHQSVVHVGFSLFEKRVLDCG